MRTWAGTTDWDGRFWRTLWGWISCFLRPWFWPEWRRIWKANAAAEPGFDEIGGDDCLRGICHKCFGSIHAPSTVECEVDHEGQAELAARYYEEGDDPEDHRCRSCSAIYDGGTRCTYCGDVDPEDTGEFTEENPYGDGDALEREDAEK